MFKITAIILLLLVFFNSQSHTIYAQCCVYQPANPQATCGDSQMCSWPGPGEGDCSADARSYCRDGTPADPSFRLPRYQDLGINLTILGTTAVGFQSHIGRLISSAMRYVFAIAGLLLFFYLLYGAFTWLSSMGNPQGIAAGSTIMTRALIGFTIIFSSYWILQIIEIIWGLDLI